MTHCEQLSDRMPEVARGRAAWSRSEAEHLATCGECQAEWDLVRVAATHGMSLGMQVDVAGLTAAVERRIRAAEAAPVPAKAGPLRRVALPLAIAAGLSLMIWGGPQRQPDGTPGTATVMAVLHELDDFSPAELEAMLELVPEVTTTEYRSLDTPESLGDLSAEELEMLLSSMEG